MNILYRTIYAGKNNHPSIYDRFVFYQEHFYDNIYYTDEMGLFRGYTNYALESENKLILENDYLCSDCSVKEVLNWFHSNPGKFRLPILKQKILIGEYYDSDSDGKCLYQSIEEKALEIAECFVSDIREWATDKAILIVGSDNKKTNFFQSILDGAKVSHIHSNKYDFTIDLNLCPDFRERIYGKSDTIISVSELIIPILIKKLRSYFSDKNVSFHIFNGIRKTELKDLLPIEKANLSKKIEEVLRDNDYLSKFSDNDIESLNYLNNHMIDLNQLAKFISNGIHNILVDKHENYLNINDGVRLTSDNPDIANRVVHMFGPCVVYGLCVADSQTIASHLQRRINENKNNRVNLLAEFILQINSQRVGHAGSFGVVGVSTH